MDTWAYFDHLGFTLVALLDAFALILVLRLGAPTSVMVITALGVAAVGNRPIAARKRNVAPRTGRDVRSAPASHRHRGPMPSTRR